MSGSNSSTAVTFNYPTADFERLELNFPYPLPPYNWLKTTKIYNKNLDIIPYDWLAENSELVVLLFSQKGVDRNGIVEKFYWIYENAKWMNLPIEVINIPMDASEEDMTSSYEGQANWFTLYYGDEIITLLQHMYQITCVPHLYVINPDGKVICSHAIDDLELYGKNAIVSWMTPSGSNIHRRLLKELEMYGDTWHYMSDHKSELRLKGLSGALLKGVSKPILSDKSKSRDLSQPEDKSQLSLDEAKSQISPSGDKSRLTPRWDKSVISPSGDKSRLTPRWDKSVLSPSGTKSRLAPTDDKSRISQIGDKSRISQIGDKSRISQIGDKSRISQIGDKSRISQIGDKSRISQIGAKSRQSQSGDKSPEDTQELGENTEEPGDTQQPDDTQEPGETTQEPSEPTQEPDENTQELNENTQDREISMIMDPNPAAAETAQSEDQSV